jgi:hypothetical protein
MLTAVDQLDAATVQGVPEQACSRPCPLQWCRDTPVVGSPPEALWGCRTGLTMCLMGRDANGTECPIPVKLSVVRKV